MLLSKNAKTEKSEEFGYKNLILQLLPHTNNSQGKNLCPMANGCEKTCLVYTGRGIFPSIIEARTRKTEMFVKDKYGFVEMLIEEIAKIKDKDRLAIRLNGFSDIRWENININSKNIFEYFPVIRFYDYTKISNRMSLEIPNYHLTFSGDTHNWFTCEELLLSGKNVALVFKDKIPETFNSWVVIDGTLHDLRFLDQKYVITGLVYKSVKNSKVTGESNKYLLTQSSLVYDTI